MFKRKRFGVAILISGMICVCLFCFSRISNEEYQRCRKLQWLSEQWEKNPASLLYGCEIEELAEKYIEGMTRTKSTILVSEIPQVPVTVAINGVTNRNGGQNTCFTEGDISVMRYPLVEFEIYTDEEMCFLSIPKGKEEALGIPMPIFNWKVFPFCGKLTMEETELLLKTSEIKWNEQGEIIQIGNPNGLTIEFLGEKDLFSVVRYSLKVDSPLTESNEKSEELLVQVERSYLKQEEKHIATLVCTRMSGEVLFELCGEVSFTLSDSVRDEVESEIKLELNDMELVIEEEPLATLDGKWEVELLYTDLIEDTIPLYEGNYTDIADYTIQDWMGLMDEMMR